MNATAADWSAPRDPGRQPERTRFAWRRTLLAVTVVGLLAIRLALLAPDPPLVAVLATVAVLAGWVLMLLVSWRRIRAMAPAEPAPARWSVPVAALATAGFAGLGLLLLLLTRPIMTFGA